MSDLNYNDLIPPSNASYPWRADYWQLLCYYCAQPIYETKPSAGYRQRTMYGRGRWLHVDEDEMYCDLQRLRPAAEIDPPRCHCCGARSALDHAGHCSVGGKARYRATPMSCKEDEVGYGSQSVRAATSAKHALEIARRCARIAEAYSRDLSANPQVELMIAAHIRREFGLEDE